MNDPQYGCEDEYNADKEFQPGNDGIGVFIGELYLKNGDFLLYGTIFGFELGHFLSEFLVCFPFGYKPLLFIVMNLVILFFQLLSLFVQLLYR